jgi:ribosomal 50S subunit-recycling heat shock protein
MTGMRIDKWLWAARFFKTRTLAAKACDLGRIESCEQRLKPAREVRVGDMLRVKTEGASFKEVLGLSEMRVRPRWLRCCIARLMPAAKRAQGPPKSAKPASDFKRGGRQTHQA